MKTFDCEQGGDEWLELRLGIPTTSEFTKIVTESRLIKSKQQKEYAHALIAERVIAEPLFDMSSQWMERGGQLEGEARKSYEFIRDKEVKQVGFVKNDGSDYGCSPDGLVGEIGMVEIKVPNAKNFVAYSFQGEITKYKMQRQAQMWVCEREWCDLVIHNPELGTIVQRTERDEEYIKTMEKEVEKFCEMVDIMEEEFREKMMKSFNS